MVGRHSAHFAARLRVNGAFTRGTSTGCDSLGLALVGMVTDFDLSRPHLVNLAVRTTGRLGGSYSLDRVSDPIGGVSGSGEDLPSVQRTTAVLTAGTYQLSGDFDTGVSSPILTGDPRSSAGTVSMTAAFTPAGVATSASSGAGRSLVTLPASRACAPRTLTATLRSGASRLDRVIFYVNGRRHATVGTRRAGGRWCSATCAATVRSRCGRCSTRSAAATPRSCGSTPPAPPDRGLSRAGPARPSR